MYKTLKTIATMIASLALAAGAFTLPAQAVSLAPEDKPWEPNIYDLQAASAQYQARDGISLIGATGLATYRVLNLNVPAEGVPADLGNGTCPGPIRYTDTEVETQYVSELGECGGWERFGWLQEGDVVWLSGKASGNYIVKDAIALGAPGNTKAGFTDTPDAVLLVNNSHAKNELHMFGLIDYTKRLPVRALS